MPKPFYVLYDALYSVSRNILAYDLYNLVSTAIPFSPDLKRVGGRSRINASKRGIKPAGDSHFELISWELPPSPIVMFDVFAKWDVRLISRCSRHLFLRLLFAFCLKNALCVLY